MMDPTIVGHGGAAPEPNHGWARRRPGPQPVVSLSRDAAYGTGGRKTSNLMDRDGNARDRAGLTPLLVHEDDQERVRLDQLHDRHGTRERRVERRLVGAGPRAALMRVSRSSEILDLQCRPSTGARPPSRGNACSPIVPSSGKTACPAPSIDGFRAQPALLSPVVADPCGVAAVG